MKRIILLAAAALPMAGHTEDLWDATPAPPSYRVIDIDYSGTVTDVEFGTRRVGEAVNGRMRIDMRFAPDDNSHDAFFPDEGDYIWNFPCERNCEEPPDAPSRFVTTRGAPVEFGGNSYDRVLLFNAHAGVSFPKDEYLITDWELGGQSELRVNISASSDLISFLASDDLLQGFELRPAEAEGDTNAGGSWHEALNGFTVQAFEFAIGHLRVTPKVCRI